MSSHPAIFKTDLRTLQSHRIVGEACRYYQRHECWHLFQGDVSELKRLYKHNKLRALQQAKALCEIHDALSAQMPVLHFKGLTLSHLLYDDIAVRECKDIDILIPQESRQQSHECMLSLGYWCKQISDDVTPREKQYYFENFKDLCYVHENTNVVVEVHTRLYPWPGFGPSKHDDFSLVSKNITLLNRQFQIMQSTYYLYYLIMHGATSAFERLHWLYDVVLFDRLFSIDYELLFSLFKNNGNLCMLQLTQNLVEGYFGEKFLSCFRKNDKIIKETEKFDKLHDKITKQKTIQINNFEPVKLYLYKKLFYFYLKKNWRYKVHWYLSNFTLTRCFSVCKLPPKFFWLYEVFKPFFFIYLRFIKREKPIER